MRQETLREKMEGNELDLSLSDLETVPVKELATLPKATHLDFSCNRLTILPDLFCTLVHIQRLDLSKNGLTSLPANFGNLDNLQHLDLLDNQLTTLPRSFSHLKRLRWLDLKDNPLEAGLKKNAGDCLDETQCKQCAARIMMYMKDLDSQLERQNQIKLKKQREAEARQRDIEEKEKQRLKQEKKAEKERRRKEAEARRTQERLAQSGDTSDEDLQQGKDTRGANSKLKPSKSSSPTSYCLFTLVSILALALGLLVAMDHHCTSSTAGDVCSLHWRPARAQMAMYVSQVKMTLDDMYHKHIEKYFVNK